MPGDAGASSWKRPSLPACMRCPNASMTLPDGACPFNMSPAATWDGTDMRLPVTSLPGCLMGSAAIASPASVADGAMEVAESGSWMCRMWSSMWVQLMQVLLITANRQKVFPSMTTPCQSPSVGVDDSGCRTGDACGGNTGEHFHVQGSTRYPCAGHTLLQVEFYERGDGRFIVRNTWAG